MLNTQMRALIGLGSLVLSLQSFAYGPALSKAEFCSDRKSAQFMQNYLNTSDSRMSFSNRGGLLNGGVCWWHSRFQRNAAYLTAYAPQKERPTEAEAKEIIKDIRFGRKVIEIPGFDSFYDFSRAHRGLIQKRLNAWQRKDGFVNQQWIVGLAGASKTSPKKLKKKMDDLYKDVQNGEVVYQKLQIKGIVAHAWLVIGMEKTHNGYEIAVIDSNSPTRTSFYHYKEGSTNLNYPYWGQFVPYTGRKAELRRLKRVV